MSHFGFLRGVNSRLALLADMSSKERDIRNVRPQQLVVQLIDTSTPLDMLATCRSFYVSSEEAEDTSALLAKVRAMAHGKRLRWIDDEGDLIELVAEEDLKDAQAVVKHSDLGWSMVSSNCPLEGDRSVGREFAGNRLVLLMN